METRNRYGVDQPVVMPEEMRILSCIIMGENGRKRHSKTIGIRNVAKYTQTDEKTVWEVLRRLEGRKIITIQQGENQDQVILEPGQALGSQEQDQCQRLMCGL